MIDEILEKHVTISLNNRVVLEGFIVSGDKTFFRLIENNNDVVLVRKNEISFARIHGNSDPVEHESVTYAGPLTAADGPMNEFTMTDNNNYQLPSEITGKR